ncbi:MAG: riboflavin synthase, partial [Arenicella sp.]
MFTGIIETLGTVISSRRTGGDVRLLISAADLQDRDISIGDSIACNGVCLTVVEQISDQLSFDVSVESINHSLIGDWQAGTKVNLEMALLPTTRLGGHLVSGHVDGLARLAKMTEDARSWRM